MADEGDAAARCCCSTADCPILAHNQAILAGLERDVQTAARLGQALLARHESSMAKAETERARRAAATAQAEEAKREAAERNLRLAHENGGLAAQVGELVTALRSSDERVAALAAILRSTELELRRMTALAGRADRLEREITLLEREQEQLRASLDDSQTAEKLAALGCKRAEHALAALGRQMDALELEAAEERHRHGDVLARLRRRRAVSRQLHSSGDSLGRAASMDELSQHALALSTHLDVDVDDDDDDDVAFAADAREEDASGADAECRAEPAGGNVVSSFVSDILQDNANLQIGIVELREMLFQSNEEVERLREQLLLFRQPAVPVPSLSAELTGPRSYEDRPHRLRDLVDRADTRWASAESPRGKRRFADRISSVRSATAPSTPDATSLRARTMTSPATSASSTTPSMLSSPAAGSTTTNASTTTPTAHDTPTTHDTPTAHGRSPAARLTRRESATSAILAQTSVTIPYQMATSRSARSSMQSTSTVNSFTTAQSTATSTPTADRPPPFFSVRYAAPTTAAAAAHRTRLSTSTVYSAAPSVSDYSTAHSSAPTSPYFPASNRESSAAAAAVMERVEGAFGDNAAHSTGQTTPEHTDTDEVVVRKRAHRPYPLHSLPTDMTIRPALGSGLGSNGRARRGGSPRMDECLSMPMPMPLPPPSPLADSDSDTATATASWLSLRRTFSHSSLLSISGMDIHASQLLPPLPLPEQQQQQQQQPALRARPSRMLASGVYAPGPHSPPTTEPSLGSTMRETAVAGLAGQGGSTSSQRLLLSSLAQRPVRETVGQRVSGWVRGRWGVMATASASASASAASDGAAALKPALNGRQSTSTSTKTSTSTSTSTSTKTSRTTSTRKSAGRAGTPGAAPVDRDALLESLNELTGV